jgi:hypothetical protein
MIIITPVAVPFSPMDGLWVSPFFVNERDRLLLRLNDLHGLRYRKSQIGVWRHLLTMIAH